MPETLPFMAGDAPDSAPIAASVSDIRPNWPGRRTVTVLLGGCDLACAYCYSPELVAHKRATTTVASIAEQIAQRAESLDGIVVSGGEPTSNQALRALLEALSEVHLPVKLDTAGTRPGLLGELIADELVHFVSLDIKTTAERYDRVTGSRGTWTQVERSIGTLITSGVDHEFRTTCYPFAVATSDLPSLAAKLVGGRRYVLQQFESRRTLDPAAGTVVPYPADELRRAALCCSVHLPTVVRGA